MDGKTRESEMSSQNYPADELAEGNSLEVNIPRCLLSLPLLPLGTDSVSLPQLLIPFLGSVTAFHLCN